MKRHGTDGKTLAEVFAAEEDASRAESAEPHARSGAAMNPQVRHAQRAGPNGEAVTLRPYQIDAIRRVEEAWQAHRSVLLVMATGTGKTVVFCELARRRREAGRTLVVAHRNELLEQATAAMARVGLSCDLEQASDFAPVDGGLFGEGALADVVVASVATLHARRLARWPHDAFATVIVDEAHHSCAATYRAIVQRFPRAKVLGVTATPDRGDASALGEVFDAVAFEYGIQDGIRDGFLAPIRSQEVYCADLDLSEVRSVRGDLSETDLQLAMSLDAVLHQIAAPLVREAGERSTIVFCAGVQQAHALGEVIAGYTDPSRVGTVDGSTHVDERSRVLDGLRGGSIQYVTNCAVLTEGFDAPAVSCIAIARPTQSRAIYTQMVGRGTRTHPGKEDLLLLDFVGNAGRHSLVTALDVLGGKQLPPEVKRRVKALAEGGMSVLDAIAKAEQEAAEAAAREVAARARRHVRAAVQYDVRAVDPFRVLNIDFGAPGQNASERQMEALARWGVELRGPIPRESAGRMLDELSQRARDGRCSYKQARLLSKHGLRSDVSFADARKIIDGMASNGWRVPPDLYTRFRASR